MSIGTLCDLDQFIDDVRGCRLIRVTHSKINNILTSVTRLHFQIINDIENVGRQAFDS